MTAITSQYRERKTEPFDQRFGKDNQMKQVLTGPFFLITTLVLLTAQAQANFGTDKASRVIKCTADELEVTVNAKRTEIQLYWAGDEAGPQHYAITKRQSDGDTFVAYSANAGQLTISFSDRSGDRLELLDSQETIDLNCAP